MNEKSKRIITAIVAFLSSLVVLYFMVPYIYNRFVIMTIPWTNLDIVMSLFSIGFLIFGFIFSFYFMFIKKDN